MKSRMKQLRGEVWIEAGRQVGRQIPNWIWGLIFDQIRNQVLIRVWDRVGIQILDQGPLEELTTTNKLEKQK